MLENDLSESAAPTRRDGVIVSDGTPVTDGQMEQSYFLDAVEEVVRSAVDRELAPKGLSTDSCPYMASSFRRYRSSTPDHVETIARRYAGAGTAGASELIAAIAARATRAARAWAEGQRLDEISAEFGLAAGASGEAVAGFGGIDRNTSELAGLVSGLGTGRPLPSESREAMEEAFGSSFDSVRLHDGSTAQRAADRARSPALTIGEHVAIDPSPPPQGVVARSVMLAHELAHVVQFRAGASATPSNARSHADAERGANDAVVRAAAVLRGDEPPGSAGRGLGRVRSLELQRCDSCGSSSTNSKSGSSTAAPDRFTDVAAAVRAAPDPTSREAALKAGITASTARADSLRSSAGKSSSPFATIRSRITSETGVGRPGSTYPHLDPNPLHGVENSRVEQAYRAWAENPTSSAPPWVLLALWVKEGLTKNFTKEEREGSNVDGNTVKSADSAADARAIWRSHYYYWHMGADHYTRYTASSGSDNVVSTAAGSGAAHDSAFTSTVAAQVSAKRLPRDLSSEINAELTVVDNGSGNYTVTPSNRFFSLSLMLVDAYWRENRESVTANATVPTGTTEGDIDQLTYMRWNMGSTKFGSFLSRDMSGNADPGGSVPPLPTWAFHRQVRKEEWGEPRSNAIRFQYASEAYHLIYEGW